MCFIYKYKYNAPMFGGSFYKIGVDSVRYSSTLLVSGVAGWAALAQALAPPAGH
jgi:hypothetical protein